VRLQLSNGILCGLFALGWLASSGCSVIGFGIGAHLDARGPPAGTYSRDECDLLHRPANIEIEFAEEENSVRGKLTGLRDTSGASFDAAYEALARQTDLPRQGEWITAQVQRESEISVQGELVLLQKGSLVLKEKSKSGGGIARYPLEDVVHLSNASGQSWTGAGLSTIALPLVEHLGIEIDGEETAIPLSRIRSVEVTGRKRGRIIGTAIGLTLDVATLIIAYTSYESENYGLDQIHFGP